MDSQVSWVGQCINQQLNRIVHIIQQQKEAMHNSFKTKPIPYSKIQESKQFNRIDQDDSPIPEEHSSRNRHKGITHYEHSRTDRKFGEDGRLVHQKQNNAFSKTYASGSANTHHPNDTQPNEAPTKRLTHGLTSYKDIKSRYAGHSGSKEKHLRSKSRSGSKSKLHCKLDEELMNANNDTIQCTFTPKTNAGRHSYRNFQDFVQFQDNFLAKKEEKIERMKKQMIQKEQACIKSIPTIDKKSRKISQSSQDYHIDNYGSLKKLQKPPIYQRLYNIPRKKDRICEDESSFTPKILNKSKSMVRGDRVQNLLYEDAQRRMGHQKMMDSEVYKKQQMISKYPPSIASVKQSKHNNKLICKKIRSQFLQFIQQGQNEDSMRSISPILAVTIISQIFNVELNPNKNEELCWFIVSYLVKEEAHKSQEDKTTYGEVQTKRLWDFIKAIVIGLDGFQKGMNCFTEEEVIKIHEHLGYFYSLRLSKLQSNRLEQAQQEQFKLETSQKTNRMAEAHRARKLQQISQFISQTNVLEPLALSSGLKETQISMEQRMIRLQDLFILDSIRKRTQLEQKKLKNEQQEMKNCTFRPSLNQASKQKAQQRRARSRQNLKTITQCNYQSVKCAQDKENKQKSKKIIIKSKNCQKRSSFAPKEPETPTCRVIKNVDKTLLRLNLARKVKDVEAVHRERGYRCDTSANWLKEVQQNKKQVIGEISNFLGYKDSSLEKDVRLSHKSRQNYQTAK